LTRSSTAAPKVDALSILVVEDDAGDFRLINAYLRRAGLIHDASNPSLTWAQSLSEAIEVAGHARPDLVLLDLSLPDSTDILTVKAMSAALPEVPIVVLTGSDDNDLAIKALEAGAQDYLIKGQLDHLTVARAARHALVRKQLEQQLQDMAAGLEEQVSQRTRQLRTASAQLTLTEERERRMLAQELHDNLGQLLAVIKIKLASLEPGSPQSSIDLILSLVDQADRSARMITRQLSPPVLGTAGLMPALEWLADEMQRQYQLVVYINIEREPELLSDEIQAVLYRSIRELLINVVKHATVKEASLSCLYDDSRLTLVVSDDGCGFDPAICQNSQLESRSFGLSSIRERITNIGGEMAIDSKPGNGTTITLSVPHSIAARRLQSS
jgi:signal transduction histidine kinase